MGAGTSRASADLETGAGINWAPAPLSLEIETDALKCWAAAVLRTGAQGVRMAGSEKTVFVRLMLCSEWADKKNSPLQAG